MSSRGSGSELAPLAAASAEAFADVAGEAKRRLRGVDARMRELAEEEWRVRELSQRMAAVTGDAHEVLDINAGGKIFSVRRETLLLATGSVLAAMFSGSWDGGLTRDSQGRPFLEVDPYIFGKIVNHLRQKSIQGPDSPAPSPTVDPDKAGEYRRVLEFYGLSELLGPAEELEWRLQSLKPIGSVQSATDNESPYGYSVRLQAPVKLQAVLVGLEGNAGGATVMVGHGSTILHEASLQSGVPPEWMEEENVVTHLAGFNGVTLQPPEVFIMMKTSGSFKYTRAVYPRGRVRSLQAGPGPFKVEPICKLPPAQASGTSVAISVVYTEA